MAKSCGMSDLKSQLPLKLSQCPCGDPADGGGGDGNDVDFSILQPHNQPPVTRSAVPACSWIRIDHPQHIHPTSSHQTNQCWVMRPRPTCVPHNMRRFRTQNTIKKKEHKSQNTRDCWKIGHDKETLASRKKITSAPNLYPWLSRGTSLNSLWGPLDAVLEPAALSVWSCWDEFSLGTSFWNRIVRQLCRIQIVRSPWGNKPLTLP